LYNIILFLLPKIINYYRRFEQDLPPSTDRPLNISLRREFW